MGESRVFRASGGRGGGDAHRCSRRCTASPPTMSSSSSDLGGNDLEPFRAKDRDSPGGHGAGGGGCRPAHSVGRHGIHNRPPACAARTHGIPHVRGLPARGVDYSRAGDHHRALPRSSEHRPTVGAPSLVGRGSGPPARRPGGSGGRLPAVRETGRGRRHHRSPQTRHGHDGNQAGCALPRPALHVRGGVHLAHAHGEGPRGPRGHEARLPGSGPRAAERGGSICTREYARPRSTERSTGRCVCWAPTGPRSTRHC